MGVGILAVGIMGATEPSNVPKELNDRSLLLVQLYLLLCTSQFPVMGKGTKGGIRLSSYFQVGARDGTPPRRGTFVRRAHSRWWTRAWATLAATEYAKRRSLRGRIKIGLMPRARLAAVRPRERRGVPARPLLVITRCKTETRHRRPYDPFQLTESSACCCAQPNRCSGSELSRLASNDHEDELPRSLFLSTVQRAIAMWLCDFEGEKWLLSTLGYAKGYETLRTRQNLHVEGLNLSTPCANWSKRRVILNMCIVYVYFLNKTAIFPINRVQNYRSCDWVSRGVKWDKESNEMLNVTFTTLTKARYE